MNKLANAGLDSLFALIAGRQHGLITTAQLLAGGLSRPAITARVRAGRLHRIHQGVYAVGHAGLSREGWWMAVVLACGEGAVLSHTSAAALWGIREHRDGPVHVTVPTQGGRARREGLRIHRSPLPPSQTTLRARIPVTRPDRTLTDLRRILEPHAYRQALRKAEYLRLRTGIHQPDGTRLELEARFEWLRRRYRLPEPERNVLVGPFLVDCLWPRQRLVVELDGFRAHGGAEAFERDRERDAELARLGYRVLRFTWRQVTREPALVARAVRSALRA